MCKKCTNSIFVIFILLVKIKNLFKVIFCCQHVKVSQRKKDICHFHLCVKYEQNRWLRHCIIKSLFHETKQFNFPEKNVPSQTCLTWVSDHFQHPHFAPSLFCSVTHPQGSIGPAVPPPLHSNTILKMHVKYWIICLLTQLH